MNDAITKNRNFWELLAAMTDKEIRVRYKNTILGFIWLIINPLIQMAVIGMIFKFIIKEPMVNYYYYLLIGLLVWNFFSLSLTKATTAIVYERNLIKKAKFTYAVIPLSIILANFIHLIIAFLLFYTFLNFVDTQTAILMYTDINNISAFLGGMLLLILFTTGISLLTSALNVLYRDVNLFVQALLIIWFYATPIAYSTGQLPKGFLAFWCINPLTSIIQLLQFSFIHTQFPDYIVLLSNFLIILFLLTFGIIMFNRLSFFFDDWL